MPCRGSLSKSNSFVALGVDHEIPTAPGCTATRGRAHFFFGRCSNPHLYVPGVGPKDTKGHLRSKGISMFYSVWLSKQKSCVQVLDQKGSFVGKASMFYSCFSCSVVQAEDLMSKSCVHRPFTETCSCCVGLDPCEVHEPHLLSRLFKPC